MAKLANDGMPLGNQVVQFAIDADNDQIVEYFPAVTDDEGIAKVEVTVGYSLGTVIPYTVSWNGILVESSDQAQAVVVDTTAPVIEEASVSPEMLWPPNHKMVPVNVTVSATDACDPEVECRIVEITSNEPVSGFGKKDDGPDWRITGDLEAMLRAERFGQNDGRIYTLLVECTDDSGNIASTNLYVTVPHDRR